MKIPCRIICLVFIVLSIVLMIKINKPLVVLAETPYESTLEIPSEKETAPETDYGYLESTEKTETIETEYENEMEQETEDTEETNESQETETANEKETPDVPQSETTPTVTIKEPKLLNAESAGYDMVRLEWKKVRNAEKYIVYMKTGIKSRWEKVKVVRSTSCTVKNLKCGTTYRFTICAVNYSKDVMSTYGNNTLKAKPVPNAPILSLKSSDSESATIGWKKVSGADQYKVFKMTNGRWKCVASLSADLRSYKVKITDGKKYRYMVKGYCNGTPGKFDEYGLELARKTEGVSMESIIIYSSGKSTISWSKVKEAEGYVIYRKDGEYGSWKKVGTSSKEKLYWSESGLSSDKKYSYMVKGYRVLNGKKMNGYFGGVISPTLTYSKEYVKDVKKTYLGRSGAGRKMYSYSIGNGKNHINIISEIHGYEDYWAKDSKLLILTAEKLIKTMAKNGRSLLSSADFTVNVIPMSNPDGYYDGYTCNGPGRCTTYHRDLKGNLVKGGIDLNRCFEKGFTIQYSLRNYTGPRPLMADEAKILKKFLVQNKGDKKNIFVDMQGWLDQIITIKYAQGVCYRALKTYFPSGRPSVFGSGGGYIASYAAYIGYDESVLFEFPRNSTSSKLFYGYGYDTKFVKAIQYMIRNS